MLWPTFARQKSPPACASREGPLDRLSLRHLSARLALVFRVLGELSRKSCCWGNSFFSKAPRVAPICDVPIFQSLGADKSSRQLLLRRRRCLQRVHLILRLAASRARSLACEIMASASALSRSLSLSQRAFVCVCVWRTWQVARRRERPPLPPPLHGSSARSQTKKSA